MKKNIQNIDKSNKKDGKVKTFFKSFTKKQLAWFIIGVLLISFGIIFTVLGLIDDYTNFYHTVLRDPNQGMKALMGGIGFTWFGIIVILVSSLILAFSLSLASKGEDRSKDKEARRRMRLEGITNEKKDFNSTIAINPTLEENKNE